jgi:hypothetical protein
VFFYDISGRVVDKMLGVNSNAVVWRPNSRITGCFIVQVTSGSEECSAGFLVR